MEIWFDPSCSKCRIGKGMLDERILDPAAPSGGMTDTVTYASARG